jgi:ADP-heptose:LPS heptosyltransferase
MAKTHTNMQQMPDGMEGGVRPERFENILCIRADNMGDLLMSSPAIRALKETFHSKISVLTSSLSASVTKFIKEIDEVIVYDLPWVKTDTLPNKTDFLDIVDELKSRQFDAAVIFTVYSQNPLPAAMLAYLAGIPVRLAYCRENPYHLLTHWIPDEEPYSFIRHQVRRDLDLVSNWGAKTQNEKLVISVDESAWASAQKKLKKEGIALHKPWLVLHPGVSEKKREYPIQLWIDAAKQLSKDFQLLVTGGALETELTESLANGVGSQAFSLGGLLSLAEFIALIKNTPLVVSVNTGTIHIAAAVNTAVVVLYALTNPQHLPWKVPGKALIFEVPESIRSKNEVIRFVNEHYFSEPVPMIEPDEIVQAVYETISSGTKDVFPEMLPFKPLITFQ